MSFTKTCGLFVATWRHCSLVAVLAFPLIGSPAVAQEEPPLDIPAASVAAEEPPADGPAPDVPDTDAPDTDAADTDAADGENSVTAEVALPSEGATAGESATGADTNADDASAGGVDFTSVLIALATLVIPVLVGNWLAAKIKMPDHAWKLATVLTTVAVGALAVSYGALYDGFKGGPDLSGGITLTFETERDVEILPEDANPDEQVVDPTRRQVDMQQLVAAIKQRIDPAGTKEVTIRSSGPDRIEVIVPAVGQDELARLKRRITDLGQLEFRILADPRWPQDDDLIQAAQLNSPSQKRVLIGGKQAGRWMPVKEGEFADDGRAVFRQAGKTREVLIKIDLYNVTGEYLINPRPDFGNDGAPVVLFNFNTKGSNLFSRFTGENLASTSNPDVKRRLGIVLDGVLISAPELNDRIRGQGQITGIGNEQEVNYLVSILDAGSLPAALNKTPLSQQYISSTIGKETVKKGAYAITVSLIAVLVFMLFYYRFAGIVACLALVTNILLVLGVMVMMNAAFTLPGLAGLVLTVGMSVDANVLIFERIREELSRGAALRMAIRNGFGRATTTIVDANLTTLITGIVLYTIGTDQIRGFAVTLVLGILISMYTAIFASRLVFDIAERRRWIKDLKFTSIIGATSIDFIGKRGVAMVVSLVLIIAGLVAVGQRSTGLLNIDFTGGTSVTMVLNEGQEVTIGDIRSTLDSVSYGEGDYTVVEVGKAKLDEQGVGASRFRIDSAIEQVADAEAKLTEAFGEKLKTFVVSIGDTEAFTDGGEQGIRLPLTFNEGSGFDEEDGLTHDGLLARIRQAAEALGQSGLEPTLENADYTAGSNQRFKNWTLAAFGVSAEEALALAQGLKAELESQPLFPVANAISGKVADGLQVTAIFAILLSLIGIVGYLWFRFQNVSFGLAAVVALVHDVLVTLGAIAGSAWLVSGVPALASPLQIDAFQISLPIVAAFLTIIGYSLNDTIVVFDRIREVRGKSPNLTAAMINTSVNQTLARTLLTSLTTLLVVGILYFFGGAGIHAFAFALVVGVIVGTYSSIFVASPTLLAMVGKKEA